MGKVKKPAKSSSSDSDSGPEDRNPTPAKKAKEDPKAVASKSEEPQNQWTLEKYRQVRVTEFRGRKMVDIREHYEKNGEILPGKKGISLSITQWQKLLEVADEVNKSLNN